MSKSIKEQLESINKIMNKPKGIPNYTFKGGKYKGSTLEEVYEMDRPYLVWIYNNVENLPEHVEGFLVAMQMDKRVKK